MPQIDDENTCKNSCPSKPIQIREVWADDQDAEFESIRGFVDKYPFASMYMEFPVVVFKSAAAAAIPGQLLKRKPIPPDHNRILKANVDVLVHIQLRLTLSDADGNLPDLGSGECQFIWQFHFAGFDDIA